MILDFHHDATGMRVLGAVLMPDTAALYDDGQSAFWQIVIPLLMSGWCRWFRAVYGAAAPQCEVDDFTILFPAARTTIRLFQPFRPMSEMEIYSFIVLLSQTRTAVTGNVPPVEERSQMRRIFLPLRGIHRAFVLIAIVPSSQKTWGAKWP